MIRLSLSCDLAGGLETMLGPDQSRYLVSVMRRSPGDEILAFNGRDGEWRCVLTETGRKGVRLRVENLTRPQSVGPDLELVVALVKRTRLETIIEKAAELGVRRVRLAITDRTNADHTNVARLQAIATEASEQTGRLDVPEVVAPCKLSGLLAGWEPSRRLIFCDEAGDARPLLDVLKAGPRGAWAVLIGPEGGFSPAERSLLRSSALVEAASLGPRILRADTAAISALTLWQAVLGDWAGEAGTDLPSPVLTA